MSEHKISGACTLCDELCFEVLATWGEDERYPGEPKRVGLPFDDAMRVTFLLYDGSKMDLTFCGPCSGTVEPGIYTDIWRKVMRSWIREMKLTAGSEGRATWFNGQFSNGILGEMGKQKWKDIHG